MRSGRKYTLMMIEMIGMTGSMMIDMMMMMLIGMIMMMLIVMMMMMMMMMMMIGMTGFGTVLRQPFISNLSA